MEQTIETKIKDVADKIAREYQPEKIILFGSHAWGKPHEWSDVDLFVVKDSTKSVIEMIRDVRRILFGNNFPPLDILVYTPGQTDRRLRLGDPFLKKIFKHGKILYAQ